MKEETYISLASIVVAAISVVTTFFLQRDAKRVRELERKSNKHRNKLVKALLAIKGYQLHEVRQCRAEGVNLSAYRSKIRKENPELFDADFLTPSSIESMLAELQTEK